MHETFLRCWPTWHLSALTQLTWNTLDKSYIKMGGGWCKRGLLLERKHGFEMTKWTLSSIKYLCGRVVPVKRVKVVERIYKKSLPFPCCLVIGECLWKKNIEKKRLSNTYIGQRMAVVERRFCKTLEFYWKYLSLIKNIREVSLVYPWFDPGKEKFS